MSNRSSISPPKIPVQLLRRFCDPRLLEDVEGDLVELFQERAIKNQRKANWLFALDVMLLLRPGIIKKLSFTYNAMPMLYNDLRTAVRHSVRQKGYTLLNLAGLAVGLASCICILLYVKDELGIDKFHANGDRTYQVWRNMYQGNGEVSTTPGIPQPLADVLKTEYPQIGDVALLSWEFETLFSFDNKSTFETGRHASPEFFKVFDFPFIAGDPATALNDLHSVVISETLAKKYFGDNWKGDALGKSFKIDNEQEFAITGIFQDPGTNSSLRFDWVMPADTYIQQKAWVRSWYNGSFSIFITLRQGADIALLRKKVEQEINKHTNYTADERIYLQLFSENYLNGNFENGVPVGGRIQYVTILSIIAVFILMIACINFMNLATARSSRRAKEIGVRKAMGAGRISLGQQFFVESFLLSAIGVVAALGIVALALPYFNNLTGKSLSLDFASAQLWIGVLTMIIITGLFSGSYPAILLSSFNAINSLKGKMKLAPTGTRLRNGLVTLQFAISILLISGTIVISKQINYILTKNLGLDKENVIMMEMDGQLSGKTEVFKAEFEKIPEGKAITFTSGNPLAYRASTGGATWDGKDPNQVVEINVLTVDAAFFETMNIQFAEGKGFINNFSIDSSTFVVNQALADIMGFKSTTGERLSVWGTDGKVIGVVKDFHMGSMYEPIPPLIIRCHPSDTDVALMRLQNNMQQALEKIEGVTKAINPGYPFRYRFLDDDYEHSYKSEIAIGSLVNIFAVVSVFISCLGLFGLSFFSAEQRAKEIGIRKIHGARVWQLMLMLSRDYALLIAIAFVLATPVAWYYMGEWLSNFAFRTELDIWTFALSGLLAFIVGALTVGFKSMTAANANPIKTLREE
jgi:putative ABC transport system permease protein